MNDLLLYTSRWFSDYYLLATVLLVGILVAEKLVGQPARRIAVAWSAAVALVGIAILCALPGWSMVHMTAPAVVSEVPVEPRIDQVVQTSPYSFPMESPIVDSILTTAAPTDTIAAPVKTFAISYEAIITSVIFCGSVALAAWLVLGAWQVRRLRSRATPASAELVALAKRLSPKRETPPPVGIVANLPVAAAIGLWQPMVLLPQSMVDEAPAAELQTVLAHELAHLRHRDLWLLALLRGLLLVLWAHPLYWMWRRRVRLDQETLADAAAAEETSRTLYAEQLVAWARENASGSRRLPLASAVGLWESPSQLRRRVAVLLDKKLTVLRSCSQGWRAMCAASIGVVAVGLSLVTLQPVKLAVAEPAKEKASAGEEEKVNENSNSDDNKEGEFPAIQWPNLLKGTVRDDAGQPIPNAKVRLVLQKIHEFSIGRWDQQLAVVEGRSDESGKFSLDVSNFPELRHRPFCVTLISSAPGYADGRNWNWYSNRDVNVDMEDWSPRIKMPASRPIRGRCVDPDGNPVGGAVVRVMADHGKRWLWSALEANSDGTFEIAGPRGKEVQYWICSNKWSPTWGSVKPSETELGDIQLETGTAVTGTVRDRDGSPVAGCVVAMESCFNGEIDTQVFSVEFATKTDIQGRYRLPKVSGAYKVYLAQAVEVDDRINDNFVVSEHAPPLVVPQQLLLDGKQPARTLDFQAGPTLRLGGTIRWEDGQTVENCLVRVSYLPHGIDFGTGIWIAKSHTNAQGKYSLKVPNPISHGSISCSGKRDADRVWHYAYPAESVEADQKSVQSISFHRELTEDRDGLDWVLRLLDE